MGADTDKAHRVCGTEQKDIGALRARVKSSRTGGRVPAKHAKGKRGGGTVRAKVRNVQAGEADGCFLGPRDGLLDGEPAPRPARLPTGDSRPGALPSVPPPPRESAREILTQPPPTRQEMTFVLMARGCQHMAPAVVLGNTSDCHIMRCSARCWGHAAARAAHSPYLLLNRICTHSRSVLMSSVSFMKASHFSIKTREAPVRGRRRRDSTAWLPLASLATPASSGFCVGSAGLPWASPEP